MSSVGVLNSLEIAQQATLIPIDQIAEQVGLQPDEVEPYGRYKAKIALSALDRLADRPDGKLICVAGMTPTAAGEGKTTTLVGPHPGPRRDRQALAGRAARAVAGSGVRREGRRGRRRVDADRADGGPQPPLHRRHPRDRRGEQSARGDDRRAHPPRQQAGDRPQQHHVAARDRHERPRAAQQRHRAWAARRTGCRARRASTSRPHRRSWRSWP